LWETTQELQRLAQGDVLITVGGGRDNRGEEVPYGVALRGLEPSTAVASDWLTETIREFARSYVEQAENTIERAERALARLLTTWVFREPTWKVAERVVRRRTDGTPAGVMLRGSFPSTAKRFPDRRVFVRFLREGDEAPKPRRDADFTLDVLLHRHLDVDDRARRAIPGSLSVVARDNARIALNLFHRASDQFYPDLQTTLQPVVSPYQVTPLLLLTLHEFLEEKRSAHLIPKDADRDVEQVFQPSLFDHASDELFNAELGAAFNARGERIVESLLRRLCEERFPEYRTIMAQQGWANALRDYQTALERLANRYERQGEEQVTGSKEILAKLFNRANTAFDSFAQTFPDLITVVTPLRGRESGAVRFTLHPFEGRVRELLRVSKTTEKVTKLGQTHDVRVADLKLANHSGRELGYRDEEIAALLETMEKRDLVEVLAQRGVIREVAHPALRLDDLAHEIDVALRRRISLEAIYPDEHVLIAHGTQLRAMQQVIKKQPADMDDRKIAGWGNNVRVFDRDLDTFIRAKAEALRLAAREIAKEKARDPQGRYQLHDAIEGSFFAPQLDAQRAVLLKAADELVEGFDGTKNRAIAILSRMNADAPTDDMVCESHRDLTELRVGMKRIEADAEVLESRGANLATARRALTQAAALERRLTQGDDGYADLGARFAAVTQQIQADLSSRKLTAIEEAARWESDLIELATHLDRRLEAHQEAFKDRKTRYLALLHEYARVPPAFLLATKYNPADPDGSVCALASEVSEDLRTSLDRVGAKLGEWTAQTRTLLASDDFAYLDDSTEHEQTATALLADLDGATERAQAVARDAADLEFVSDVDADASRFARLMQVYAGFVEDVARIGSQYQKIAAVVRIQQPSADERRLLETIRLLAKDGDIPIDMGTVLHERGVRDQAGIDEIWQLLKGLHAKRRLRIAVLPVHHD
ncbi:MAG: hypothetical protein ACRDJH_20855, partial [Thermomicrobiales bacterium]